MTDHDPELDDDGIARPWEGETDLETERCDCGAETRPIGVGCEEDGAPFVTYECLNCTTIWDEYEHWSVGKRDRVEGGDE